ncbi:hypothetical protein IQ246_24085 [aff. Roholtiella sp. LEGE 12411]|nr:hypothetical protein [aff. Roholtiella sp. LEGE 12411]
MPPASYKTLIELVNQAQETITQIQQHSSFKNLDYYPDLTIGDADQALEYLRWELQAQSES